MSSGGSSPKVSPGSSQWNDATIEKMTSPSCTADTSRAENDPPSRIAPHVQQHGPVGPASAQEVAVQRVREPVVGHGQARGEQRLRRDLPAVQDRMPARLPRVHRPEQVAVEPLETEDRRKVGRGRPGVVGHGGILADRAPAA